MESNIDNTKRDLYHWIRQNERFYKHITIQITDDKELLYDPYLKSTQMNLDRLMNQKKKAIELYLSENTDPNILDYIIEINNHIKKLLGL